MSETTETAETNAYLMWVGTDHYPGITDWTDEAIAIGISKRLPSADVGKALMNPGTVIFVAHDEGEHTECAACFGVIECGECRKRAVEIDVLQRAIDSMEHRYGYDLTAAPPGDVRYIEARRARINKINAEAAICAECDGRAEREAGTGGRVVFEDGTEWDYRRFNYWLHQPSKFSPDGVVERHMCADCGGTGVAPDAKVFGLFVPSRIEYILSGDEDEDKLKTVEEFTKVTKEVLETEVRRGCGYRKPGGVYVYVETETKSSEAKRRLDELVELGIIKPEGAEIFGSFVRFLSPVPIVAKRFRGIKHIDYSALSAALVEETEMVMDGLS